jgi:hypothetical protein
LATVADDNDLTGVVVEGDGFADIVGDLVGVFCSDGNEDDGAVVDFADKDVVVECIGFRIGGLDSIRVIPRRFVGIATPLVVVFDAGVLN